MIRTLILCLVLVNAALAQKVLHVSTIPAKADIYVQKIRPDHTQNPDYVSPAFIPVSEEQEAEGEIIVSLFHPDFADTTVRVRLSDRDTSYLIMSQRGVLDESLLEKK